MRASIDFDNQRTRAYYVCPTQLRREGSSEAEIMQLVSRQSHASEIMLIEGAKAINDPAVKAGHEASLKLVEAAARYLGVKK